MPETLYPTVIFSIVALTSSLAVCVLAVLHHRTANATMQQAVDYRKKAHDLIDEIELHIRQYPSRVSGSTQHVSRPVDPAPRRPPTALEMEMDEVQAMLSEFLTTLKAWDSAAPTPTGAIEHYQRRSQPLTRSLQMATTIQQIGDIQTQFEVLQKETVSFALAESDQSLDVARKVKLLQAELRKLVELCRLTVIDPPRGSAFDQQRHNSMGTMRTDPGCSRGTIAAVLSRGLLGPESEVLKLAEVKVYD